MSAYLLRMKAHYFENMRGYPKFSLWIPVALFIDLLYPRGPNLGQKPLYLVGTLLKWKSLPGTTACWQGKGPGNEVGYLSLRHPSDLTCLLSWPLQYIDWSCCFSPRWPPTGSSLAKTVLAHYRMTQSTSLSDTNVWISLWRCLAICRCWGRSSEQFLCCLKQECQDLKQGVMRTFNEW